MSFDSDDNGILNTMQPHFGHLISEEDMILQAELDAFKESLV